MPVSGRPLPIKHSHMSPVAKVIIATAFVALLLFFGISQFLGGSERLSGSIDVRSLSHLRNDGKSQSVKSVNAQTATRNPMLVALEAAPERTGESVTVKSAARAISEDEALRIDGTTSVADEEPESVVRVVAADELSPADKERARAGENDSESAGNGDGGTDSGSGQAENQTNNPEETEAQARARKLKEKLGIKEPKPPTRAVDVKLVLSPDCNGTGVALAPVSVQFRYDSPTIRGRSLQQLELLVAEYRRCQDGNFQLTENSLGKVDASPALTQMRFDELKYFFIQHSVPKTSLLYPE